MRPRKPLPPEPPDQAPFPLLTMAIPFALAVLVAALMASPIALLMGALGPLMVWVGWSHALSKERKDFEKKTFVYEEERHEYEGWISRAREEEKKRAGILLPSVFQWLDDPVWRLPPDGVDQVRIGEGWWEPPPGHPLEGEGGMGGLPTGLDTTEGVALVAPAGSEDLWRSLALQWALSGGIHGITPSLAAGTGDVPRDVQGKSRAVWVEHVRDIPDECRIIIRCTTPPQAVVSIPGEGPRHVRLDSVPLSIGLQAKEKLTHRLPLPSSTTFQASSRDQFVGRLSDEADQIDLVEQGPHCVIWGATGSGKSVSVCALVGSLAETYSPDRLVLALIDFKGGAGLKPLANLPHTIGQVSDLELSRSARVRQGLGREMVRREAILASAGVSDWADLPDSIECPRLMVVIDEVAWLCTVAPQWLDTIGDIARRGRSLGVHLVLSTQRISGVLPRDVMANVSLRVCARVSDESEASEWMHQLSPSMRQTIQSAARGRVLVQGATMKPRWQDVSRKSHHPPGNRSRWRVWSEELPTVVSREPGSWGVLDDIEHQRHVPCTALPAHQGVVAIVGDSLSGKTATALSLATLAPTALRVPGSAAELWACLHDTADASSFLVIDDADQLLQSTSPEGESLLLDALGSFPGAAIVTFSPQSRVSRALARIAQATMVLGIRDLDDRARWDAPAQWIPGRLRFRGQDIQVSHPAPDLPVWEPQPCHAPKSAVVFTSRPESWAACETAFQGLPQHISNDIRESLSVTTVLCVVDGIPSHDVRAATFGAVSPPPFLPPQTHCWVREDGRWCLARTSTVRQEPS